MNIHSIEQSFNESKIMRDLIQEQLIAARRSQILDAAVKVFAEKGFNPATIKDIAKVAGIADGTIYNYFENKTALLIGILDRMKQTAIQDANLSTLNPADLSSFMKAYFTHALMTLKADNFELFRVVMSEIMVNPELRTLYYQTILEPTIQLAEPIFQRWADQQAIKPVDIKLLIRAISGMVMGLMVQHIMATKR